MKDGSPAHFRHRQAQSGVSGGFGGRLGSGGFGGLTLDGRILGALGFGSGFGCRVQVMGSSSSWATGGHSTAGRRCPAKGGSRRAARLTFGLPDVGGRRRRGARQLPAGVSRTFSSLNTTGR